MKISLICLSFFLSLNAGADPLKKVLKRESYCSPLQKMIGACGSKKSKKEEVEDKEEIKKAKKKSEQKEEEEAEEFLR